MKAIYKWTNLINGKNYIGKTIDVASRVRGYRKEVNKGTTRPIISALRKYGFENFEFTIIENCDNLNDEEILQRE